MIDALLISGMLADQYGLALTTSVVKKDNGLHIVISPAELPQTEGFIIDALIGWATIEVSFVLGNYASAILKSMNTATAQQITIFKSIARAIEIKSSRIKFIVNSEIIDIDDISIWQRNWESISANIVSNPMEINHLSDDFIEKLGILWCGKMLGLVLSLLPIEQDSLGEEEGAISRVEVNRYERSKVNRAACIEIHGLSCHVCGFNFEGVYGDIGYGYVEVHHIEPISNINPGVIIDPSIDLVPLCSNCHSMIHRKNPPYSVKELKVIVNYKR